MGPWREETAQDISLPMAVFQRLKRVTHAMAHTSPNSSPDTRNIWQCRKIRVRWGCSWTALFHSCFPGPGMECWEEKYKLGVTKPGPESGGKHSLRSTEGASESPFCLALVLGYKQFLTQL